MARVGGLVEGQEVAIGVNSDLTVLDPLLCAMTLLHSLMHLICSAFERGGEWGQTVNTGSADLAVSMATPQHCPGADSER